MAFRGSSLSSGCAALDFTLASAAGNADEDGDAAVAVAAALSSSRDAVSGRLVGAEADGAGDGAVGAGVTTSSRMTSGGFM